MIFGLRKLLPVLERIQVTLGGISEALHALNTRAEPGQELGSRVAALELEMERRHAEAEGLLLKAKGKFDAARAAEERTRRLTESSEPSEEEQLDALRSAYEEAGFLGDDGEPGEGNGMYPVPVGLEGRFASKQNAHAMKFKRR